MTQGRLLYGDPLARAEGVSSDSRGIRAGELFVPLQGPNFDGQRFIREALNKGGAGSLVRRGPAGETGDLPVPGKFLIEVDDVLRALGDLAHFWRREHPRLKVVAITGSNGKTTTKEMAARILSGAFRALKTEGNLNNLIGLPLMLLRLAPDHEVAVLEMGMSMAGEIRRLRQIAEPQVSLITNIGRAHLELLGSLEGIARAKGELWEELRPQDWIAVNGDDPRVVSLAAPARCGKIVFGLGEGAEVRGEDLTAEPGGLRFSLVLGGQRRTVRLKAYGRHNVLNALGAASLAAVLGLGPEEIAANLEGFGPYAGRGRVIPLGRNIRLLDDTYNSNPDSLEATLSAFAEMKGQSRGLAVLGDMLELGTGSADFHRKAGERVGAMGLGHLFLLGDQRGLLAGGARSGGMEAGRIHAAAHPQETLEALESLAAEGDWILIKGSRRMRMERLVQGLIERLGETGADSGRVATLIPTANRLRPKEE